MPCPHQPKAFCLFLCCLDDIECFCPLPSPYGNFPHILQIRWDEILHCRLWSKQLPVCHSSHENCRFPLLKSNFDDCLPLRLDLKFCEGKCCICPQSVIEYLAHSEHLVNIYSTNDWMSEQLKVERLEGRREHERTRRKERRKGWKERMEEEKVWKRCAYWLIFNHNIHMVQICSSAYLERIDENRSLKKVTIKTVAIWPVNLSDLFFSNKFSVEKVWWWYPSIYIFPLMHIDTWESNVLLQMYLANRKHLWKSFNCTTAGHWGSVIIQHISGF